MVEVERHEAPWALGVGELGRETEVKLACATRHVQATSAPFDAC
jgi:hypothetical protein